MRPIFFFLILLLLTPIASASTITRTFSISEIYFNSSNSSIGLILTHKQYNITLTPSPLTNFDLPGYYITEYLPIGFKFISTNADKYTLTDNKLKLLKFLPTSNNSTLTYTLQYKKDINPIPSFYGTYLDENRNYSVTTQYTESTSGSGSSGSTSTIDSTPVVTYTKSKDTIMTTPTPTYIPEFIPLPASQVQVIPYTPADNTGLLVLSIIVFISIAAITFIIPQYHKEYHIRLLSNGDVIIDKKPIGVTEVIKFTENTKHPLAVKIIGDISKVVTSIKEAPCDKKCFEISIKPDGKDHEGSVVFIKKNVKTTKYKIK